MAMGRIAQLKMVLRSVLDGGASLREWAPPGGFAKVFCGVCGSSLWSRSPDDPDVIAIRLGAFDGDPGIRPGHRQFVTYAAVWDHIPDDGLPRFAERPPR